mmetsp:Transcript_419/g.461  ORF Transcript_419/g.461 Transcript_419/m.461 type:complete len:110 (+) Transcript_419:187-516(+)
MVQSLLCFLVLLIEEVIKDVFISLDEPLRVLLPVLELFIPVPLDPLQQRSESQLLLMSQLGLFLLNDCLHLCLQFVSFKLFKEVSLHLDLLCFLISLHFDQLGLFVPQL